MDTNGNKFGGYTTSSWAQPSPSSGYARDTDAFVFNLSKKLKYIQPDKYGQYSIYRSVANGPTFGYSFTLKIDNNCTNNSSSNTKATQDYKTDNKNLINSTGNSSFQVSYYEVYRVVSEL